MRSGGGGGGGGSRAKRRGGGVFGGGRGGWWGRGIGVEAAGAVFSWGVAAYGLTRVWASTDVRHVRSQRVLEKLGMRRETVVLREQRGREGEEVWEFLYGVDVGVAVQQAD